MILTCEFPDGDTAEIEMDCGGRHPGLCSSALRVMDDMRARGAKEITVSTLRQVFHTSSETDFVTYRGARA